MADSFAGNKLIILGNIMQYLWLIISIYIPSTLRISNFSIDWYIIDIYCYTVIICCSRAYFTWIHGGDELILH